MNIKRQTKPRTRFPHQVTIEESVWQTLVAHCLRHNQNPGEVIEESLAKHLDKDLREEFG